jgi:hypothetical protein
MTVSKEIKPATIGDEFRICPSCGYNRGFQVSFLRKAPDRFAIVLICPECGARYSPDWNVGIPAT